jgi:two-component system, OmpR family, response regulator MprA
VPLRVLIVEDEKAVRDSLQTALELEGYDVVCAADGETGLLAVEDGAPDAIVLDRMLPGADGLAVARRLRADKNPVPILMAGLDAGADDYLVKPFALEELLARLRALLRRHSEGGDVLAFADVTLDPGTREVKRGERPIELTRTEFNLLELFLRNPRQVLRRSLIYERVWGYDFGLDSHSLDVYIGYLRRKLEAGGEPRLIRTVRGVGYALREP